MTGIHTKRNHQPDVFPYDVKSNLHRQILQNI